MHKWPLSCYNHLDAEVTVGPDVAVAAQWVGYRADSGCRTTALSLNPARRHFPMQRLL